MPEKGCGAISFCANAARIRGCRRIADAASVAAAVALVVMGSAHAQTLTDALAEAYNTNPQLLAQRALLRATDEQVPQALSFWRPTVNFSGQVGSATTSLEEKPGAAAQAAGKLALFST